MAVAGGRGAVLQHGAEPVLGVGRHGPPLVLLERAAQGESRSSAALPRSRHLRSGAERVSVVAGKWDRGATLPVRHDAAVEDQTALSHPFCRSEGDGDRRLEQEAGILYVAGFEFCAAVQPFTTQGGHCLRCVLITSDHDLRLRNCGSSFLRCRC